MPPHSVITKVFNPMGLGGMARYMHGMPPMSQRRSATSRAVRRRTIMGKEFLIKPEAINALCGEPLQNRNNAEKAKAKKGFWHRLGDFFKKAWNYVLPIITTITLVLNAVSRFKETQNRAVCVAGGSK
jgi:stalled ribosome alternative rescue factor ArfA